MAYGEGLSGAARRDDGVFPVYAEYVVDKAQEIDYGTADIIHFYVDGTLITEY